MCKARIDVININEEALYNNATDLSISKFFRLSIQASCFRHDVHLFHFAESLTEMIRHYGVYNGLLHIMLYRMVAHVVKELGMPPGGEFRIAFEEVN